MKTPWKQCCEDWAEGEEKINAALFIAVLHGCEYDMYPFRYCPWCGTKLPPSTMDLLADVLCDEDLTTPADTPLSEPERQR